MPKQSKSGSKTSKRAKYTKSGGKFGRPPKKTNKTVSTVKGVPLIKEAIQTFKEKSTSQIVIRALTTSYRMESLDKDVIYAIQIGTIVGRNRAETLKKEAKKAGNKLVFRVYPGTNEYKIYVVPSFRPMLNKQIQVYGKSEARIKALSDDRRNRDGRHDSKIAKSQENKSRLRPKIKDYMKNINMTEMLIRTVGRDYPVWSIK